MKELQEILEAWKDLKESGRPMLLATVVGVSGSTYRRPGARMIITPDRWVAGSISGGCLEGSILEEGWQRTAAGDSVVLTYDATSDEDIIWGFGLGCRGIVRVLVEHLQDDALNPLAFIEECFRRRQAGVLVTVVSTPVIGSFKVGSRLALHGDGRVRSSFEDHPLYAPILEDAKAALASKQSIRKEYAVPEGSVEVFLEVVRPPKPLVIFGAGHDAVPLVRLGREMGWRVTVVDWRAAYASRERFPEANELIVAHPSALQEKIRLEEDMVAVVMTHNYLYDRTILDLLLRSPVGYIGLLGPRARTERLLAELRDEGLDPGPEGLERLHGPVGLDIGADNPQEIALAIVSEIQAASSNRNGGALRDSTEPLHGS